MTSYEAICCFNVHSFITHIGSVRFINVVGPLLSKSVWIAPLSLLLILTPNDVTQNTDQRYSVNRVLIFSKILTFGSLIATVLIIILGIYLSLYLQSLIRSVSQLLGTELSLFCDKNYIKSKILYSLNFYDVSISSCFL